MKSFVCVLFAAFWTSYTTLVFARFFSTYTTHICLVGDRMLWGCVREKTERTRNAYLCMRWETIEVTRKLRVVCERANVVVVSKKGEIVGSYRSWMRLTDVPWGCAWGGISTHDIYDQSSLYLRRTTTTYRVYITKCEFYYRQGIEFTYIHM